MNEVSNTDCEQNGLDQVTDSASVALPQPTTECDARTQGDPFSLGADLDQFLGSLDFGNDTEGLKNTNLTWNDSDYTFLGDLWQSANTPTPTATVLSTPAQCLASLADFSGPVVNTSTSLELAEISSDQRIPSCSPDRSQPLDCEALVKQLLESDKQAKLDRLMRLKEEKTRIAEEERRLEQGV